MFITKVRTRKVDDELVPEGAHCMSFYSVDS